MSNALPKGTGTKAFSGARAIFMVNGTQVAFASGVDGSKEIQYQAVDTLDNLLVVEHVPVGIRVTLSCSIYRTVSKGPSTNDTPGSLEQQNIFPRDEDVLTLEGVDALIQDSISNKTLYLYHNVKAATFRYNMTARGLVMQNATFVTTQMQTETN